MITLPPLPERTRENNVLTDAELRARDLEIARLVLEEAARKAESVPSTYHGHDPRECARRIRNLEIKHHEPI